MTDYSDIANLNKKELADIISLTGDDASLYAMADKVRRSHYGDAVYIRGLIEVSSYCKNNCLYCGIRASNSNAQRYRLGKNEILSCCREGYELGFRTFVLQGGEDAHFTDAFMCDLISSIKSLYPDCAVTLSLGERSADSYKAMRSAGADRYLIRHETADEVHYNILHPMHQTLDNRMRCLRDLKEIGSQTGCGIMVGSPGQTSETIAKDMIFMQEFEPEMIGIGPFLPHKDTPFKDKSAGSVKTTLFALALSRIMLPWVLLPSTTALGTAEGDGRKMGVLAGCNVVMPNLSPIEVRKKYMLYDNKAGTDISAQQGIAILRKQMEEIGYDVVIGKGDFRKGD